MGVIKFYLRCIHYNVNYLIRNINNKLTSRTKMNRKIFTPDDFAHVQVYKRVLHSNEKPAYSAMQADMLVMQKQDENLIAYWLENNKVVSKSFKIIRGREGEVVDRDIERILSRLPPVGEVLENVGLIHSITSKYDCETSTKIILQMKRDEWKTEKFEKIGQLKKDLTRGILVNGENFMLSPEYERYVEKFGNKPDNDECEIPLKEFVFRVLLNTIPTLEEKEKMYDQLQHAWSQFLPAGGKQSINTAIIETTSENAGKSQYLGNLQLDKNGRICIETITYFNQYQDKRNIKEPYIPGLITERYVLDKTDGKFNFEYFEFSNSLVQKITTSKTLLTEEGIRNAFKEEKNRFEQVLKLINEPQKKLIAPIYDSIIQLINENPDGRAHLYDALVVTRKILENPSDATLLIAFDTILNGTLLKDSSPYQNNGLITKPWAKDLVAQMKLFQNYINPPKPISFAERLQTPEAQEILYKNMYSNKVEENGEDIVKKVKDGNFGIISRTFNNLQGTQLIEHTNYKLLLDTVVEAVTNNESQILVNFAIKLACDDLFDMNGELRPEVFNALNIKNALTGIKNTKYTDENQRVFILDENEMKRQLVTAYIQSSGISEKLSRELPPSMEEENPFVVFNTILNESLKKLQFNESYIKDLNKSIKETNVQSPKLKKAIVETQYNESHTTFKQYVSDISDYDFRAQGSKIWLLTNDIKENASPEQVQKLESILSLFNAYKARYKVDPDPKVFAITANILKKIDEELRLNAEDSTQDIIAKRVRERSIANQIEQLKLLDGKSKIIEIADDLSKLYQSTSISFEKDRMSRAYRYAITEEKTRSLWLEMFLVPKLNGPKALDVVKVIFYGLFVACGGFAILPIRAGIKLLEAGALAVQIGAERGINWLRDNFPTAEKFPNPVGRGILQTLTAATIGVLGASYFILKGLRVASRIVTSPIRSAKEGWRIHPVLGVTSGILSVGAIVGGIIATAGFGAGLGLPALGGSGVGFFSQVGSGLMTGLAYIGAPFVKLFGLGATVAVGPIAVNAVTLGAATVGLVGAASASFNPAADQVKKSNAKKNTPKEPEEEKIILIEEKKKEAKKEERLIQIEGEDKKEEREERLIPIEGEDKKEEKEERLVPIEGKEDKEEAEEKLQISRVNNTKGMLHVLNAPNPTALSGIEKVEVEKVEETQESIPVLKEKVEINSLLANSILSGESSMPVEEKKTTPVEEEEKKTTLRFNATGTQEE